MERPTIDKNYRTTCIIGTDERIINDEFNFNEQSVDTYCQCGDRILMHNGLHTYCECGRKHELITYLRTEWATINQDELED